MVESVATITQKVFNKLVTKMDGVIHAGTLSNLADSSWDVNTGSTTKTVSTQKCRMLSITASAKTDKTFGDFIWKEHDQAFLLEGLTTPPVIGNKLSVVDKEYMIVATQDILLSGTVFMVIGRKQQVVPASTAWLAPLEPTALTATKGDRSVVLSWIKSASGSGTIAYKIAWKLSTDSDFTEISSSTIGDTATFTVRNLINATSYDFKLKAINQDSVGVIYESDWSPVISQSPTMTFATKITLDSANANPTDVEFYNDKFWVPDGIGDKVFSYHKNGTRNATDDFDLNSRNRNPTGICYYSGKFYITDSTRDQVYAYTTGGVFKSANGFRLSGNNPVGIAARGTHFFVVDDVDDKVFGYGISGIRAATSDFNLRNTDPHGIAIIGTQYWIPDTIADKIYSHLGDGSAGSHDIDLDVGATLPRGVCVAGGDLWVVDEGSDDIRPYSV